jgi:AraC family transcriptional regulator of adaptative response/methylated-DNA-[protein]-cysteine methyltransferase
MYPNNFSQQADDYQRVEQSLRYLEANFRSQPGLDEIAASVHLSKYHFQRLFKRWAGITPTQFLHYLTVEYAKQQLAESRSIYNVALDAGLSGSGRLHDLFVTFEAMSPGEYKRQGAGLKICYGFHDTPFGPCLLATTQRGVCGLDFVQGSQPAALAQLSAGWPQAEFVEAKAETRLFVDQIFAPTPRNQPRPFHLLLKGTNFQVNVWQALLTIPAGSMVSYQGVAAYVGKPRASRAVANAIAHNPIAYLIPCHRVIRKSGDMHGYRWGTTRKRAILGWEAGHWSADGNREAH